MEKAIASALAYMGRHIPAVLSSLALLAALGSLWFSFAAYRDVSHPRAVSEDAAPLLSVATSSGQSHFMITRRGDIAVNSGDTVIPLEVAGPIRLTKESSEGCGPALFGALAYNPLNGHFWGCDGRQWLQLDNR